MLFRSVKANINSKGQVISCDIISTGVGYTDITTFEIRSYSVLVLQDSNSNGLWGVYSYNPLTRGWSRLLTQTYDSRKYWNTVDWYADGYDQFIAADYTVDTVYDLSTIQTAVGDVVKIRTSSSGEWMLLYRYSVVDSINWASVYNVVGVQNGTIQLSSTLYKSADYDGSLFDSIRSEEHTSELQSH